MTRQLGIFDRDLAGRVFASRQSDKVFSLHVHGNNPNVGTGANEDIWDFGGTYTYINAAQLLSLVSSDAQDNPAGTGIASVHLSGIDANFNPIDEIVILNGITPVNTINSYLRVHGVSASDEGTLTPEAVFAGNLSVNAGATLQAFIFAGNTATRMSFYTIPANYTGFIDSLYSSGGPNDDFVVHLSVRHPGNYFVSNEDFEITNSAFPIIDYTPSAGPLDEKTDIKAVGIGLNPNTSVRITFGLTLIRNDYLQTLVDSI